VNSSADSNTERSPARADSPPASELILWRVPAGLHGQRLDKALVSAVVGESRSYLRELVDRGCVRVGGSPRSARFRVRAGDEIEIRLVERAQLRARGPRAEPPLVVLFEDDAIAVVDKPPGQAVHPGGAMDTWTVAEAAVARFGPDLPREGGEDRPGIVHRLDMDTSGVLVLAKTEEAWRGLKQQFQDRSVEKVYRAVVHGEPRFASDYIETPITRDPRHRQRMKAVREGGREAVTYYEVVECFRGFAELRVMPKTGRTHQIRVHLSSLAFSVVSDPVYRARSNQGGLPESAPKPSRQALHAERITVRHPSDGRRVSFEAALPEDITAFLDWLRRNRRK